MDLVVQTATLLSVVSIFVLNCYTLWKMLQVTAAAAESREKVVTAVAKQGDDLAALASHTNGIAAALIATTEKASRLEGRAEVAAEIAAAAAKEAHQ